MNNPYTHTSARGQHTRRQCHSAKTCLHAPRGAEAADSKGEKHPVPSPGLNDTLHKECSHNMPWKHRGDGSVRDFTTRKGMLPRTTCPICAAFCCKSSKASHGPGKTHQSSAHTHQRPGRTQIPTARNLCWLAVPMLDGCSIRRLAAGLQQSQELFCRCGENNSPNTMLLSKPLNKIDKHPHPLTAGSDHTSRPLPTPTPSTAARVQTAVQRCAAHLAPFTTWAHSHCTKTREGNKSREELHPHTLLVPW